MAATRSSGVPVANGELGTLTPGQCGSLDAAQTCRGLHLTNSASAVPRPSCLPHSRMARHGARVAEHEFDGPTGTVLLWRLPVHEAAEQFGLIGAVGRVAPSSHQEALTSPLIAK